MLANNVPFAEDTQIVTVSKFGAKLKTRIPLQVGMQLKVQPLRGKIPGSSKSFGLAGRARRAPVRWESNTRGRLPTSWELISPTQNPDPVK